MQSSDVSPLSIFLRSAFSLTHVRYLFCSVVVTNFDGDMDIDGKFAFSIT